MGADGSRKKYPVPEEMMEEIIAKYGLQPKDLAKMYKAFQKADLDKSGSVTIDEFYEMLDEKRNVFGNEIFELLDTDYSGGLDFTEFVNAVCVFGFFGKLQMYQFCFYIFDKDKNGFISQNELKSLITLLYTKGIITNLKAGLFKYDTDKDGVINFKEFTEMARIFPQMLHPAFQIQHKLQQRTLGVQFFSDLKQRNLKAKKKAEREKKKAEDKAKRDSEKQKDLEAKQRQNAELQLRIARGEAQMACCGPCAYDLNATDEAVNEETASEQSQAQKMAKQNSGPKTKFAGLEGHANKTAKVGPEQAWSGKESEPETKRSNAKYIDKTVNDALTDDEIAAMSVNERRKYERNKGVDAFDYKQEKLGRQELRMRARHEFSAVKQTKSANKKQGPSGRTKRKKSMLSKPKRTNRF